jgi:hypothetical protein
LTLTERSERNGVQACLPACGRQAGFGVVFGIQLQILMSITRVALKALTCEASSGVQV